MRTCTKLFLIFWILGSIPAEAATRDYPHTSRELTQSIEAYQKLVAQHSPYDVVFHRDPMTTPIDEYGQVVIPAGLTGGLSVPGIIWSPTRPLVLIDQELIREGQQLGSYTVLKVKPNGVVAEYHNQPIWVPLASGTVGKGEEQTP